MAVSERRRLFARGLPAHPLTPHKLRLLQWVADCRLLTVPQLAGLSDASAKSVMGHMRDLFDLGLVTRAGVPRAALADVEAENVPVLLWGRAPTIYTLSREGANLLVQMGLADTEAVRDLPVYGPKNALFVAHELQVRDVRVWLETAKRRYGHAGVTRWKDGVRAIVRLEREAFPREVRPDAWFVYALGEVTLAGFVEIDRGTERAPIRWQEKFTQYAALIGSETGHKVTGQKKVRVLVIASTPLRRDTLAAWITQMLPGSGVPPDRFWFAERKVLAQPELGTAVWRVPGREGLLPLVSDRFLEPAQNV